MSAPVPAPRAEHPVFTQARRELMDIVRPIATLTGIIAGSLMVFAIIAGIRGWI